MIVPGLPCPITEYKYTILLLPTETKMGPPPIGRMDDGVGSSGKHLPPVWWPAKNRVHYSESLKIVELKWTI